MRRFHRWLGLGSTAIVLATVVTGLLWAYAPYLYWAGGYMEKKHPTAIASFDQIALTHQYSIRIAREQLGKDAVVSSVTLRSELGTALYEVTGQREGKEVTVLIDAASGKVLSPLTPEFATQIARQYVAGEPPVQCVKLLDQFEHRSGKTYKSVYQVRFQLPKNPEILLSAASGKILEDQDDVRRFHFGVMRLHQLNFFGFKKTLTIIPGTAMLLLIVSGVMLSRRRKSRVPKPVIERASVVV
ncbi:PepSY domain-containing protein [Verrucomicrobiota bacterium sgz303538]